MTQGNKRLAGETFKKYRERLKDEAVKLKKYMKGRYIWIAKDIYDRPKDFLDPMAPRTVIYEGLGTYRRSMGAIGTRR